MEEPKEFSDSAPTKKVDESWKENVENEKDGPAESAGAAKRFPTDIDFSFFVSGLGMQALFALGELPDPVSGERKTDLEAAHYLIDVVQMLSEKTKGNLSDDERHMMDDLLYELRVKFVQKKRESA